MRTQNPTFGLTVQKKNGGYQVQEVTGPVPLDLPANYLKQPVTGYMKTDASGLVLTVNGKSMTVPVGATFSPETLETIRGYLAAATDNLAYCSYPVAPVIRICDQVLTIDPARLMDYVDRELMEREDMLRNLEKKPQLIAEEYDAMDGLESSLEVIRTLREKILGNAFAKEGCTCHSR